MKIGFIQGRLSPIIDGKIQAFPWDFWEDEFALACKIKLNIMEWTLDQGKLNFNPLMNCEGQNKIKTLCNNYNIKIPSLTGDCFMQFPFFKFSGKQKSSLLSDLKNIIKSCFKLDISLIVFPLVDNSSIKNSNQKSILISELIKLEGFLEQHNVKIIFESDLNPNNLRKFINNFPSKNFGINYDIGNSASLGFDYRDELNSYGDRILNVHVKDRLLNGETVPLGLGNANIPGVIKALQKINYNGNYILQTARSKNENHVGILSKYRDQLKEAFLN